MKHLLVPLDLTTQSKHALFYSLHLAKDMKLKVLVIYVSNVYNYMLPTAAVGATPQYEPVEAADVRTEKEALEHIKQLKEEIAEHFEGGPEIDFLVKHGSQVSIVKDVERHKDIAMLVLPAWEEEGFVERLLGNDDFKTLIRTTNPALIIPEKAEYKTPEHLLYATDYKYEDVAGLKQLTQIAEIFGAHITALHVTEDMELKARFETEGFKDLVADKVDYKKIDHALTMGHDVVNNVEGFAERVKADWIVLMRENQTFWQRILRHSPLRRMIWTNDHLLLLIYNKSLA